MHYPYKYVIEGREEEMKDELGRYKVALDFHPIFTAHLQ